MDWIWEIGPAAVAILLMGASYLVQPYRIDHRGAHDEFRPHPLYRGLLISGSVLFLGYLIYEIVAQARVDDPDLFTLLIMAYLVYLVGRVLVLGLWKPTVRFDHGARAIFRKDQMFLNYAEIDRLELRRIRRWGSKRLAVIAKLREGEEREVISSETRYNWFRERIRESAQQAGLTISGEQNPDSKTNKDA
ncbi:hypothetical protein GF324_11165 [bacterium]|nr:hypothetical protein [bacterium]